MWKNSSWVDSLPAMNWISSTSSRSGHPVLHPEILGAAGPDGGDQLVGELFAGDVHDDEVGVGALDLDLDGGEQMGLAQARPAVDEQGIIGPRGIGRHGLGGRKGELVGGGL